MKRTYEKRTDLSKVDLRSVLVPGSSVVMRQKQPGKNKLRATGPYTVALGLLLWKDMANRVLAGVGVGFGLEFPMEIKKTYFNVEFLYHRVNYFDKFTQDYRQLSEEDQAELNRESKYGYEDLRGDAFDIMFNYVINW